MRAPFSAIDPLTLGVSMPMRGEAASASSRLNPSRRARGLRRLACIRLRHAAGRWRATHLGRLAAGAGLGQALVGLLLVLRQVLVGRRVRHEEELPSEQHDHRQHDGEDKIAVVLVHVAFSSRAARSAMREGKKLIGSGLAARLCRRGLVYLGKRAFKILDQLGEGPLYRASPRDQHIIIAFGRVSGRR